jgi:rhodanese-related sulfurtransferase
MQQFRLIFITALCFGSLACGEPAQKTGATHLDPTEAASLLADKEKSKRLVVLDIRTGEEFRGGAMEDARNIDFYEDFESEVAKLDKDKPYLVYCASGWRSRKALEVFRKLGFKEIYHLDGGFGAWRRVNGAGQ